MIGPDQFSKKHLVFIFCNDKEKVSFKNDNIVVKNKDGKIIFQSTCWQVLALFIVGGTTITSGLIERSKRFAFPIFLMKSSFKCYEVLGFKAEGNTLLNREQYSRNCDNIARYIVKNKIDNQCRLLKKRREKSEELRVAIADLASYSNSINENVSIEQLLGVEGSAARRYFEFQFDNCNWKGRKPRAKIDYVNSTLDLGYTILFNFTESLLGYYGFDMYVGIYHKEFYQRKSLVCDLVEPFRCIIDNCVRNAISLCQCKEEDFELRYGRFDLRHDKYKSYILFLTESILKRKMEIFSYIKSYYRAFSRNMPINNYPYFEV